MNVKEKKREELHTITPNILLTITLVIVLSGLLCFFSPDIQAQTDDKEETIGQIIFVKQLDCYIDLSKIVEITNLNYYGYFPDGYYQIVPEQKESWDHQGEYYFTIKYQLKKDVKHYMRLDKTTAQKTFNYIIAKWKEQGKN